MDPLSQFTTHHFSSAMSSSHKPTESSSHGTDVEAEPLTSPQPYAPHSNSNDHDATPSSWKKWSVRAGIVTLVAILGSLAMDAAFRGPNADVTLREAGTWSSSHGKRMCEGKQCREEAKVKSHSEKHEMKHSKKSGKELSDKSGKKEVQSSANDLFDDMREYPHSLIART